MYLAEGKLRTDANIYEISDITIYKKNIFYAIYSF